MRKDELNLFWHLDFSFCVRPPCADRTTWNKNYAAQDWLSHGNSLLHAIFPRNPPALCELHDNCLDPVIFLGNRSCYYSHCCFPTITRAGTNSRLPLLSVFGFWPANDRSVCGPPEMKFRCSADFVAESSAPSYALVIYPCWETSIQIWRSSTRPLIPKPIKTKPMTAPGTSSLRWNIATSQNTAINNTRTSRNCPNSRAVPTRDTEKHNIKEDRRRSFLASVFKGRL